MLESLPKALKEILSDLCDTDYPGLNTRLFFGCWLAFAMDKSLISMRDLFKRLNNTGIDVDISTFSKASKVRNKSVFIKVYGKLLSKINHNSAKKNFEICPIDSTTITLTSTLLWASGYYQVKLFSYLNSLSGETLDSLVSFGDGYDAQKIDEMTEAIPTNAVGVMARGFASLSYLKLMTM